MHKSVSHGTCFEVNADIAGYIIFSFDPRKCVHDVCYMLASDLEPLQLNCSLFLTQIPPGSPLPAASVGHAVQTDQRPHDKDRVNTGAHSAAQANSVQHVGPKKHREKNGKRKQQRPLAIVCIICVV